ncbi:MAG: hypothetical protein AB7G23_08960 [Vicinamibacterales bacterium]
MRDPKRIQPILKLMEELWTQNPDLRLGQLLVNAIRPSQPAPEVFYAGDDRLLDGLRDLAKNSRKQAGDGRSA